MGVHMEPVYTCTNKMIQYTENSDQRDVAQVHAARFANMLP